MKMKQFATIQRKANDNMATRFHVQITFSYMQNPNASEMAYVVIMNFANFIVL